MDHLRERHPLYYTIYRIMLESGARSEHVLLMLENWSPNETIEVPGSSIITKRLVCGDGFCRYYMGLRGANKPCEWIYFSRETLKLIESIAPRHINRYQVTKYAKRNNLLLPKYMRKVAWRLMIKVMSREVSRFIQSRFGELRVSEARYEDLLSESDENYPKYLNYLSSTLNKASSPDL